MTEGTKADGQSVGEMSIRTATRLAWSLWALSMTLTTFSLLLLAKSLSHPGVHIFDHWFDSTLAAIAFSTVGAVIALRTPPDNPIGWLTLFRNYHVAKTLRLARRPAIHPRARGSHTFDHCVVCSIEAAHPVVHR